MVDEFGIFDGFENFYVVGLIFEFVGCVVGDELCFVVDFCDYVGCFGVDVGVGYVVDCFGV